MSGDADDMVFPALVTGIVIGAAGLGLWVAAISFLFR